MPSTPYISIEDFMLFASGNNLSWAQTYPEELYTLLLVASNMVDGYCRTSFRYQEIEQEMHDWIGREQGFGAGYEIYPYFYPVRSISSFQIVTGQNYGTGAFTGITIPVTPVIPSSNPLKPPRVFGSVFVDNNRGFVQTTLGSLNFDPFIQIFPNSLQPTSVLMTYTAGYDPGIAQSDGYILLYPDWLVNATRMIATEMVGERILGASGMTGLQSLTVGDVHMSKMSGRLRGQDQHSAIPADAKEILRPHQRVVLV